MYTVYVLYSDNFDKHYVGFTSDLEKRLRSHNELGIKGWTIKYRPWRLIYSEEFVDKRQALKREKYFKIGIGRAFIKSLNKI